MSNLNLKNLSQDTYLRQKSTDSAVTPSYAPKCTNTFENLKPKIELAVKVLEELVSKVVIASTLPLLIKNDEDMTDCLTTVQIAKLKKYCEKYTKSEDEPTISDFDIDYHLLKAVELIYSSKQAKDFLQGYVERLPQFMQNFLESIADFCQIIQGRLKMSATMELYKEKNLNSLNYGNMSRQNLYMSYEKQLKDKEVSLDWKTAEKQALIYKYQRDLAERKWENNIKIQREVQQANQTMHEICDESEKRIAELKAEAENLKQTYKNRLNENMNLYKQLKERKLKILAQLEGWIKKYDNDVGEKIRENEDLSNTLKQNSQQLNEFLEAYKAQEIIYLDVVAAKDAEEKMIQEERLMMFMMNRAARIIQVYWRRYLKSKKKKGKGKKGKKGKK